MKNYKTSNIRNLALVGHSGAGKTSLTEALLFKTGVIDKKGRIENGNTVSDYEKQEKKRHISLQTSIIPIIFA